MDVELRFWICDAQEGVRNVKSAVLLRIWDKFREHGIKFSYLQRDLHVRSAEALAPLLHQRAAD